MAVNDRYVKQSTPSQTNYSEARGGRRGVNHLLREREAKDHTQKCMIYPTPGLRLLELCYLLFLLTCKAIPNTDTHTDKPVAVAVNRSSERTLEGTTEGERVGRANSRRVPRANNNNRVQPAPTRQ